MMGDHPADPALEVGAAAGDAGPGREPTLDTPHQPRAGVVEPLEVADLRRQLSALRSLLVLSMLMTESGTEAQILRWAVTAVPSLSSCETWGVHLERHGWRLLLTDVSAPARAPVERRLAELEDGGGRVELPDRDWGYAYPVRGLSRHEGHLVVGASAEPSAPKQFLVRALAQQVGVALVNARMHAQERASAQKLGEANAALQETVGALRRRMDIHERLTEVVLSGRGLPGIAEAVHDVTGHAIAIEDRHGNVQAWAGPDDAQPPAKRNPGERAQTLRRAVRSARPVRDGDRMIALARPRDEVLGVLALVDPDRVAGDHELIALEHGATVLAMELAHLRSLAESDLRRARDLVDELLADPSRERVLARAQALGYDLERPHRVVVVAPAAELTDRDGLLREACSAVAAFQPATLAAPTEHGVALLVEPDVDWTQLRDAVEREHGHPCHVGVGGVSRAIEEFPRSFREARVALKLQRAIGRVGEVQPFDALGVYRLLAAVEDPAHVEAFVREWLGSLIDYDERKNYELVLTLFCYLEHGGQYETSAAQLNVHRNTLKYRLRRIQELSGHDLRDPATRFNLQLATSAWKTLRALRS